MKSQKTKGRSLKFKMIGLNIGMTFLMGLVTVGVLRHIIDGQEKTQLKIFEGYSKGVGEAVAAQFFERYYDGQVLQRNPAFKSGDAKTISSELNTFISMYSMYDLMMVVDSKGKLVSVNTKGSDGKDLNVTELFQKNYAETPWFQAVMSGKTTDDSSKSLKGTYFEDVQIDPYASQVYAGKKLGTSFSTAIKDDSGKIVGVLSGRAGARWFESAFREKFFGLKESGFPSSNLTLVKKDGTLLFEFNSSHPTEKSADPKYDWEQLLKVNLATLGNTAAQDVIQGKSGSLVQMSQRTHVEQVTGFAPVRSEKFAEEIGWGILVRDSRDEVMKALNDAQKLFYLIFSIVMSISCVAAYFLSTKLSKTLSQLAENLSVGSKDVASASGEISDASSKLSEAATEQASAIQETAASIDEVSAMVKKSAENASDSQKVSQTSRQATESGQKSVEEMIRAMREISDSNSAIVQQVEEGNRQISEIVKVISEIGNKTKVINDIVFQTKLLSFNASVEAARAGEHGKGFAVVAEEVGNLAAMSGNAAKEISTMLDSSIQKVENIVTDSKSKLENLVSSSKRCFESGTELAQQCGEALSRISSTVQEVDGMVGEISSASHEQAQGVSEINKAINSLDQATQQNSAIAQRAATSAEQLNAQSIQLHHMVEDLFTLVNGSANDIGTSEPKKKKEIQHEEAPKNLVSFKPKKKLMPRPPSELPKKMAVGDEMSGVPSNDDPRFEDI